MAPMPGSNTNHSIGPHRRHGESLRTVNGSENALATSPHESWNASKLNQTAGSRHKKDQIEAVDRSTCLNLPHSIRPSVSSVAIKWPHLLNRSKPDYAAMRSLMPEMAAQSAVHWECRHAGRAARFRTVHRRRSTVVRGQGLARVNGRTAISRCRRDPAICRFLHADRRSDPGSIGRIATLRRHSATRHRHSGYDRVVPYGCVRGFDLRDARHR